MTSCAEEEIFEANLPRRSSMIQKTPNIATDQQSPPSHVQLADGTSLTCAEFDSLADEEISANTQDGDVETAPALVTEAHSTTASKDPNPASEIPSNDPNGGTSATPTELHNTEHGSKHHGKDTSAACAESHSTEDGGNNSATPATGCLRSNPLSASRLMATQKQKSKVMADVNENIDSEDEDNEEDFVKTKGRIPQAGISKAQELGNNTLETTRALGKEYGKSVRMILIEAGLMMKATQKESLWNQHQTWFAATCPLPKGVLGAVSPGLMMAVHDAFTKSRLTTIKAAYWHRTHGIHIAGVAIFPGDKEAGHQASGLFAGTWQSLSASYINYRYKDLEAAHAKGKTFSLLPPSSTTPNGTLLCNGKPARDRNRKVAPMMISEKFAEASHPLKTSNSRWLTMLDILYAEKLCIHDWPAGVPLPGPNFDFKALSASQLHALVAPYLRIHLGAMYEAELGLDDDNDDSEAEAAKVKKHKGKSKKSGDKGRKEGPIAEEPSVVLHISRWPESDILALETQATNVCLILLIIDTDSRVIRSLQDSEKFIKDLPQDDTPRRHTNEVIKKSTMSNPAASRLTMGALRPNQEASCSNQTASHFNNAAPSSNYIRKWTWPHYESAQETEDLERETVEERCHARVLDNAAIIQLSDLCICPASPNRPSIIKEDEYY
ncbi:uncharacterized protein EDB91DRAFT_1088548 [Suillus paluster]|uniref:uncharacterized protein n=1 Tax=Suillus paluster TaxID=48578 RepID=UPI001B871A7B|nr:uncharacterized protein EDB91DRAFT_1088548 [Suillus paluster]KAG1721171.1 hypothetical protein EDB91DRAFT_1088548 [Suillus paluster]